MQRNYNNRSIEKILNTIKELVDISSNKEKISVDLEITTTDGYTNKIQINKENDSNLSIKKNIIMNDNVAISMDNITKVKILNNNDNPNFKKLLIKEIQDSTIDEENNYRYDPNTGYSRAFSNKLKDKNIEDYIRRNYKDIKNINDSIALKFAYIYDINYDECLEEFKQNLYYFYKQINFDERFKEIFETVNKYIDERIDKYVRN